MILFGRKSKNNYHWAQSCSILAEFGTLSLEFNYLTDLTGNNIYKEKVFLIILLQNQITKKYTKF